MKEYNTVLETSQGRYEEKRSVFIAELFPCATPEQAAEIVAAQKTKYHDARHVVHAFCFTDGSVKFADDGEPHGTSGKPVLDVITGARLENVLMTVTRYFGGVLLGTGGLVHAYSSAARDAVNNAKTVTMCPGKKFTCKLDYQQYQTMKRILYSMGCTVDNSDFNSAVTLEFTAPMDMCDKLKSEVTEAFAGKIELISKNDVFFVKK